MNKLNISKRPQLLTLIFMVVAFVCGSTQFAQAGASSLGDVFCNAFTNTRPFGNAFQWVAYVAGCACTIQGIWHLRGHTESPQNFPLHRGILLLFGASCLLALPKVVGAILSSLYATSGGGGTLACTAGGTGAAGGAGLDVMLTNFVGNIKGPLVSFVSVIAIVAGLYMIIRGLMKASKYGFDPKTHSIHSILTHIGFGALLMTIGDNLNMMLSSVFGDSSIGSSSVISWTFLGALAGGASAQFQAAVVAGLTFFQLIGMIAFVRGWLIMKKVVEGGGNVTMGQGITHILGGVLAVNIYTFLKIMDTTFGTGML